MASSDQQPGCNHLVASDLHLTFVMGDEDRVTDGEFIAFLDHYREHLVDSRPWRLVLAGDTFDFVYPAMELFIERHADDDPPEAGEAGFLEHWDIDAVAWRMRQTMLERRELFVALGRFLLAGNQLSVIKGNHDVELQWAVLQRTFLDTLIEVVTGAGLELEAGDLRRRITFHAWFYFDGHGLFVEHGSQYDEFNCTPNLLDPALVHDSRRAFMPLGSRLTQYLTNAFPEYRPRPAPGAFQKYIKESGQQFSRKYVGRSLKVMGHALANAGLFSEEGWRTGTGKEDHRLVEQARRSELPVEQLARLQALQAKPATAIRGFFFNRMLLDRLFVLVFCLACLVVALLCGAISWHEPSLLSSAALGPLGAMLGLYKSFRRPHWFVPVAWIVPAVLVGGCVAAHMLLPGGTVQGTVLVAMTCFVAAVSLAILPLTEARDLRVHLEEMAARVREVMGAQIVVFGHHHLPNDVDLGGGRRYMNAGAWVSSGADQKHAHVVLLRRADSLDASLRLGRDYLGGAQ